MALRELAGGGGDLSKKMKTSGGGGDRTVDSVFASAPSNSFLGPGAMVSFGAVGGVKGSGSSFYQSFGLQENRDEYLDNYFSQPEKKRRLSVDQLQFLEKSFEVENKLEPERKLQLANELGLQPRQIAVWFQNRKARCKTKYLETEYETLHSSYKSLRNDYDSLLEENEKLKAEVLHLKHGNSGLCDTEEPSAVAMPKEAAANDDDDDVVVSNDDENKVSVSISRNDQQSSARSDVTNEDSPHFLIDEIHYHDHEMFLELGESSHGFDHVQSVLSLEGEDCMNEELLRHANVFPKMDDAYCHPHATSCGYGSAVEDHAFNFWSY